MQIDFKEYTRIRDIVVKRNKRAARAGLMPEVHFPTVAEIKAGYVDAGQAMRYLKQYYSGGSQVKAIRATGLVPETKSFPVMPKPKPLTGEEKSARRRQQQRQSRQRQRIRRNAPSAEKAKKYISYIKAVQTYVDVNKRAGIDLGFDPSSFSPTEAQAFSEYIEYRFSQADFKKKYVIDEFIEDYAFVRNKYLQKGYSADQLQKDFSEFLISFKAMRDRSENMDGLTPEEAMQAWKMFVHSR